MITHTLPGPGWLIVFIGIAILGTGFPAAHRLNAYIKGQLHRFWRWWRARNAPSARDPRSARAAARSKR